MSLVHRKGLMLVCVFSALILVGAGALEKAGTKEPAKLKACKCGSIKRIHVAGHVYLAGQPARADLKKAKDLGIKTVINLRTAAEMKWKEAAEVKRIGMQYYSIPFRAPSTLSDAVFNKVRKLLKDKRKQPLLLHCASANRVGAVWLAYRTLDDGIPYERALKEARIVGLRSRAYEKKAATYIKKRQSKRSK